jgi:hypothetical protein
MCFGFLSFVYEKFFVDCSSSCTYSLCCVLSRSVVYGVVCVLHVMWLLVCVTFLEGCVDLWVNECLGGLGY